MKRSITVLCLLFTASAWGNWKQESRALLREYNYACRSTEVNIDRIITNDHISGHVRGLPVEALDKFKVVFYVKTNRWYVHPFEHYEGQDEGLSYALLNHNGEFKIKTVRRQVPAREMVAVLVPKSYRIFAQRWWLKPVLGVFGGVLKYQCAHKRIQGDGSFFH
jgi:hypothetical protein